VRFRLRWPFVAEPQQQANNEDLLAAVNEIAQFLSWGDGVPAHTPDGRQLYVRRDGGANTTLYVYEGAAWAAK
jgi:hypothetical protein